MIKVINHIEANRGKFNKGKHLKFPIASLKYLSMDTAGQNMERYQIQRRLKLLIK